MKSLLTIFVSIIIITTGVAQTTRRVNNNPGISGTNVYATAQAAHDAAVANDILIIDPSSTSYGDLTLAKPLKIYGNGYFLTTNTELKADQRNSTLNNIWFNTGSGGSEMYGITTGLIVTINGVSNITISRNNFGSEFRIANLNKASTTFTNVSNLFIFRNYLSRIIESGASGFTISSVLINNNIIGYIGGMNDPGDQNWVIRNNTFTVSAANTGTIFNSVLENNFFSAGGTLALSNVQSSYNVSTAATFSGGIFNVNSYDIITDPQLLGAGTGISVDEAFQVRSTSTLKTLGSSSSEVGAYGGITPYIVSGIPAIPSITSMINTGTGDATTPVKVTISVKSNN